MKTLVCYRLRANDGSIGDWTVIDISASTGYMLYVRLKNGALHAYTSDNGFSLGQWCKMREFDLDKVTVEFDPETLTIKKVESA